MKHPLFYQSVAIAESIYISAPALAEDMTSSGADIDGDYNAMAGGVRFNLSF